MRMKPIYGHGQGWNTAPPPYGAHNYRLPQVLKRTPFDLLRSHSYPKHPVRYRRGIRQWAAGGQNPEAIFLPSPVQIHPYSHPSSSARAISEERTKLQQMRTMALADQAQAAMTESAAFLEQVNTLPRPYEKFAAGTRKSVGAKRMPFDLRFSSDALPPEAQTVRDSLRQGVLPDGAQTVDDAGAQGADLHNRLTPQWVQQTQARRPEALHGLGEGGRVSWGTLMFGAAVAGVALIGLALVVD